MLFLLESKRSKSRDSIRATVKEIESYPNHCGHCFLDAQIVPGPWSTAAEIQHP